MPSSIICPLVGSIKHGRAKTYIWHRACYPMCRRDTIYSIDERVRAMLWWLRDRVFTPTRYNHAPPSIITVWPADGRLMRAFDQCFSNEGSRACLREDGSCLPSVVDQFINFARARKQIVGRQEIGADGPEVCVDATNPRPIPIYCWLVTKAKQQTPLTQKADSVGETSVLFLVAVSSHERTIHGREAAV